jgi:polyphosphate kinase
MVRAAAGPQKKKKTSRRKVKSLAPPPPVIETLTAAEYVNREVGQLEFNSRVLYQALSGNVPLLERVRFLSIFNSNMDEFFMKRVGGLKRQVLAGVTTKTPDGIDASTNLQFIRQKVMPLFKQAGECFDKEIVQQLEKNGIFLLDFHDLKPSEKEWANLYFRKNVFPVLTPLAVDPGHPFPFLSNLSVSLGVTVKHPERDEKLFARIKVPRNFSQWIRVESAPETYRFLSLISLIKENLKSLFPHMEILGVMPFRVTRNADIARDEEDAEDLLEMIEEELRMRRFARVIRIEHGANPDPWMLKFLMEELELGEEDVYELGAQLDFTGLNVIADINRPELKYPVWTPLPPPVFADEEANVFQIIKNQDVLVHHPYESFGLSVERFLTAAVEDPKVLAIKMTLYRAGDNSPLIPLLIRAVDEGKQVVVLVELKARFDEARNIYWAQELEKAGIHVVYGVVGLKTHTKMILVIREETEGLRSYVHIGTGNYNPSTAKIYTDFGMFTCKDEYTDDVIELFHFLTGRSLKKDYKKLLVAPITMRDRFCQMIEREIKNRRAGKPAQIIVKTNSMEDQQLMKLLYQASQAGVSVDLIVRGFCCLRPQVSGLSDNIRVTSVIGRFLEHSRVFYFRNAGKDPLDGEFYIGSADWMYRNLNARVEAVTPVEDKVNKERLWEVLQIMINDTVQAWSMQSDGTYRKKESTDAKATGTHDALMGISKQKWKQAKEEMAKRKEETAEQNGAIQ